MLSKFYGLDGIGLRPGNGIHKKKEEEGGRKEDDAVDNYMVLDCALTRPDGFYSSKRRRH